jgi:hypothetical protein
LCTVRPPDKMAFWSMLCALCAVTLVTGSAGEDGDVGDAIQGPPNELPRARVAMMWGHGGPAPRANEPDRGKLGCIDFGDDIYAYSSDGKCPAGWYDTERALKAAAQMCLRWMTDHVVTTDARKVAAVYEECLHEILPEQAPSESWDQDNCVYARRSYEPECRGDRPTRGDLGCAGWEWRNPNDCDAEWYKSYEALERADFLCAHWRGRMFRAGDPLPPSAYDDCMQELLPEQKYNRPYKEFIVA